MYFERLQHTLIGKTIILVYLLILFASHTYANRGDSVYIEKFDKVIYYNSDTVFTHYALKGYLSTLDDLYEYYEDIFPYLDEEKKRAEILKIRNIAKSHKNKELEKEAVLLEVLCVSEDEEYKIFSKSRMFQRLADEYAEKGDTKMQLRALEHLFDLYWRSERYSKLFAQINTIDKALQQVTDAEYPRKNILYYRIGSAYFFFQDYDKAIPYLRKALKPARYFYDYSSLRANNILGSYFRIKGDIDSSDYYFREAYNSYDKVKSRTISDAIALTNLGYNRVLQEKYDDAIPYFRAGFERMLQEQDYKSASEVTIGLAKCYLGKNDMPMTKQLIDSSYLYIEKSKDKTLYQFLYPVICNYYIRTGNKQLAEAYLDSAFQAGNSYLRQYDNLYILRAEQEVFESETLAMEEALRHREEKYNDKLFYGFVIIALIAAGLIILFIMYRKNRAAYRALVMKNQDWAEINTTFEKMDVGVEEQQAVITNENNSEPDMEDIDLMQRVSDLVHKDKIYKDIDLTLDSLSKQMDVNRNYLSKAINKTTNKNFNTYINEYRIKEAVKILSNEKSDVISIDAIALEVGFSNRTSFYQSFKKITGLTPSEFRSNKVKNTIVNE